MHELKLKVPEQLERRMDKLSWVDWPKMAVKSLSEKVEDIEELEMERKIAYISEISPEDKREVNDSVVREVVESIEKTENDVISGKKKPMSLEELDKLMGLK